MGLNYRSFEFWSVWTLMLFYMTFVSDLKSCDKSWVWFIFQYELTKSLGADVLVFELVIGCVGVDHNPLHAVAAELLLSLKHQSDEHKFIQGMSHHTNSSWASAYWARGWTVFTGL